MLASVLGCLAGLVVSIGSSFLVIAFGWLNFALASSRSHGPTCDSGTLAIGITFTAGSIAVAAVAWYLLVRYRKSAGWWVAFARGFTTIVALFMLAPWPCGLTFPAAILLSTCRPH